MGLKNEAFPDKLNAGGTSNRSFDQDSDPHYFHLADAILGDGPWLNRRRQFGA
jgi:hypothetical protein